MKIKSAEVTGETVAEITDALLNSSSLFSIIDEMAQEKGIHYTEMAAIVADHIYSTDTDYFFDF